MDIPISTFSWNLINIEAARFIAWSLGWRCRREANHLLIWKNVSNPSFYKGRGDDYDAKLYVDEGLFTDTIEYSPERKLHESLPGRSWAEYINGTSFLHEVALFLEPEGDFNSSAIGRGFRAKEINSKCIAALKGKKHKGRIEIAFV